jgi:hypothetical protein
VILAKIPSVISFPDCKRSEQKGNRLLPICLHQTKPPICIPGFSKLRTGFKRTILNQLRLQYNCGKDTRVFKLKRTTLSYSIHNLPSTSSYGGSTQVLTISQENALNLFIRSYLDHNLLPTKGIILAAIIRVRQPLPPPSKSWFQKWWKTQPLRKIRTKPVARLRVSGQDKTEVQEWFKNYREVIQKHNIKRRDIWNFDETGFRVGCPKGEEIYVPLDVKEVRYFDQRTNII